ncbi:MAG: hypothetical protein KBD12_01475 [Candidatus Pacebacteria bacterium]|nr:hypothetical protein [Candidatus Paceibacterota bacterium]
MLSKLSSSKIFLWVSFFGSLLALTLFSFLRIPFLFSSLQQNDLQKNFIFILLGLISSLSFFIYLIIKKEINSPVSNLGKLLYLIVPIVMILSTIFSPSFSNSFFGKYISTSNLVFFSSLTLFIYIISAYLEKGFKSITWLTIMVSSLVLTMPIMIAIILLRLNMPNIASYFVYLVGNWDIVAVVSALIVVVSLVYFETIAFSTKQKAISVILMGLHLILVFFIIIPDIWYALALSSLGILLISVLNKKTSHKKFYNRLSFYVFIISLFFSILFSLPSSWTKVNTLNQKIGNFSLKYSGINYSFVKPRFNLSFDLGVSRLKKGEIFGAGLNEFNSVWQKEKPQTILTSTYWNTEFTSSYSALTTFFVTIGITGVLAILLIIGSLGFSVYKEMKKKEETSNFDDENKFYFLSSVALFIFSTALLLMFVNIQLAITLFALSVGLLSAHVIKWKEIKVAESGYLLFFFALIVILSGSIININRERSSSVVSSALSNFQKDNDSSKLESNLIKAARISNDDVNYRLLTQYYLYEAQQLISASSTNKEELQKNFLSTLNNAITASKAAINIDENDYNNYLTLGSVYSFSMNLDKQNKDAYYQNAKDSYARALTLYPKNPSIPLTLAQLQYSYNQNSSSTIDNIQKSLEIKPNYSSAYYILSQIATENNDRNSALKYAAQAIQADPNSEDAYMQYGILILNKKDLSKEELNEAYTAFMTILDINQSNLTAGYYLAITYTLANDFTRAHSLADSLLKLLPNEQKIKDLQTFIATQERNTPNTSVIKK